MKEAEAKSARESVVIEPAAIKLSISKPVPDEVAKRFGESMGLYDRPEHSFRMYAAASLG